MKIERLTENKIRVIVNSNDLNKLDINIKSFISKTSNSSDLFLNILEKAETELNFDTTGHKLLIETVFNIENSIILTITKYLPKNKKTTSTYINKRIITKRKNLVKENNNSVYKFEDFDIFCDFCNSINNNTQSNLLKLSKNTSLHLYQNSYYLIIKNTQKNINTNLETLHLRVSEFATKTLYPNILSSKILEYGKVIIKNNTISKTLLHFSK